MKKIIKSIFVLSLFITAISFAQTVDEDIIEPTRPARSVSTTATTDAIQARSARSNSVSPTATSARSARSTTAVPTATSARSARSSTVAPTVTSARSARSTSSTQPATTSARSARGTTVAPATSARSARGVAAQQSVTTSTRSARTATGTRTTGRTQNVRTARGRSLPATTAIARSGVSRAGITNIATATKTTATTTTATESTVIDYATLIPTDVETAGKTAEEVVILLANETACKEKYVTCMDSLCQDTTEESKVGRCLCSSSIAAQAPKEKELTKLLANINQMQWQSKNLTTAKAKADIEGKDFALVLQEVTEQALADLGVTETKSASDTDIYEVFLGEISDKTVRKEGNAKLKEAQTACQTMLEICPNSKKQIQDTYSILAGNDCRVYATDIEAKLAENKVILQNAYNQYQMKDTEYSLGSKNKYNAEECGVALNTCMKTEEVCGLSFEYCYSDAELETRKPLCQSVLNQCQGVNMPSLKSNEKRTDVKTDVLWKSFKKSVLSKSQLTNQQCFEQSKACVITVCGEDYSKCSSGTIQTKGSQGYIADIKTMASAQCNDIIKKCPNENNAWERIINEILITDAYTDIADVEAYDQLNTCMTKLCGLNFVNCKNNTGLESLKSNCADNLMKATRHQEIWEKFKTTILNQYGYTYDECSKMISDELAKRCGNGYYDCRTGLVENFKTLATDEATKKCDKDVEALWKDVSVKTVAFGNKTANDICALTIGSYYNETNGLCEQSADYTACQTKGGIWENQTKTCSCANGSKTDGMCITDAELTLEQKQIACTKKGGDFNTATEVCTCVNGENESGICMTSTEALFETNKKACSDKKGDWNDATQECKCSNGETNGICNSLVLPADPQTACTTIGGTWTGSTCSCGYGMTNDRCTTKAEYDLAQARTACDAKLGNWVDGENKCSCQYGEVSGMCKTQAQDLTEQQTACTARFGSWDSLTSICSCEKGTKSSGVCKTQTDLDGEIADADAEALLLSKKNGCETGNLGTWNANNTCTCNSGYELNGTTYKCDETSLFTNCKTSGSTWLNNACSCEKNSTTGLCKTQIELDEEKENADRVKTIADKRSACETGNLGTWNANNTCTCNSGYELNGTTYKCDETSLFTNCKTSGSTWLNNACSCEKNSTTGLCKTQIELDEEKENADRVKTIADKRSACETGNLGTWNANNTCTCDSGYELNGTTYKCDETSLFTNCKTSGSTWLNNACSCEKNSTTGLCKTQIELDEEKENADRVKTIADKRSACETGNLGTWNANNTCTCDSGYELNGTTYKCDETSLFTNCKTSGSTWLNNACSCEKNSTTGLCKTQIELDEEKENADRVKTIADKRSACETGNLGTWNANNTCTCDSGYELNGTTYKCDETSLFTNCKQSIEEYNAIGETISWSGNSCSCKKKTDGSGNCITTSEFLLNKKMTACTSAGGNGSWNTGTSTCTCNSGYRYNSTTYQCNETTNSKECKLNANAKYNNDTDICQCLSGYEIGNNKKCVSSASIVSCRTSGGTWTSSDTCSCPSSTNLNTNSGQCVTTDTTILACTNSGGKWEEAKFELLPATKITDTSLTLPSGNLASLLRSTTANIQTRAIHPIGSCTCPSTHQNDGTLKCKAKVSTVVPVGTISSTLNEVVNTSNNVNSAYELAPSVNTGPVVPVTTGTATRISGTTNSTVGSFTW